MLGSPWWARGTRRIRRQYAIFRQLVGEVDALARRGRISGAMALAQAAAEFAWRRHAGVFASPELERMLLAIGMGLNGTDGDGERRLSGGLPRTIGHVLSTAYDVGGHTRLVWRWIQQDAGRIHGVLLTRQGTWRVPPRLVQAARQSGGSVVVLDASADPVRAARTLRAAAKQFDLLVLHTHPDDVLPLVAFANPAGLPPVALLNHADHVFWLGVGVSDLVVNLRTSGLMLAQARRHVPARRCAILPLPLGPVQRAVSPADAKQALGLPRETVLILTVGSGFKYAAGLGPSLVDLLVPVLRAHPQAVLWAVGPRHGDQWEAGARATAGRVRAFNVRGDVDRFYQAADVFLNTYPLAESLTAMVEAAGYGVPVVSYAPYTDSAAVLGADGPGLDEGVVRATTSDEYRRIVSDLVSDPALRRWAGSAARTWVQSVHTGTGWMEYLERVYAQAVDACAGGAPAGGPVRDEMGLDALDVILTTLHERGGFARRLEVLATDWARRRPLRVWAQLWLRHRLLNSNLWAIAGGASVATGETLAVAFEALGWMFAVLRTGA
jgi:hypothetical protein